MILPNRTRQEYLDSISCRVCSYLLSDLFVAFTAAIGHIINLPRKLYNLLNMEFDISRVLGGQVITEEAFSQNGSDNDYLKNLKTTFFSSYAVLVMNRVGVITDVNDFFLELMIIQKKEVVGRSISVFHTDFDKASFFKRILVHLRTGEIWEGKVKCKSKRGSTVYMNIKTLPIRNIDNEIVEYWSIVTDLTEDKYLKERLAEVERESRMKDCLMQEMHHRIKNNLQLLISTLRLVMRNDSSMERTIEDTVKRINAISRVHDIFYNHQEIGPFQLKGYLSITFEENRFISFDDVKIIISGSDFEVNVDTCTLLGLVLNELILNSMKHAWQNTKSSHKEIRINCLKYQSYAEINYCDNGQGFVQNKRNTGLGSYIVHTLIVDQLGGELTIEGLKGIHVKMKIPLDY